jgi:diacylglycerol kinase
MSADPIDTEYYEPLPEGIRKDYERGKIAVLEFFVQLRETRQIKIQAAVFLLAVAEGIWRDFVAGAWLIVFVILMLGIMAEIANTVVEKIAEAVAWNKQALACMATDGKLPNPEQYDKLVRVKDPVIKKIKDMAAATVTPVSLMALAALIVLGIYPSLH